MTFLAAAVTVCGQGSYKAATTKATISGTSTLHDWESEITKMHWKSDLKPHTDSVLSIRNVEAVVLVEGIKSKEGKIMDNKTYDAFDYKRNPNITFVCRKVTITPAAGKKSFKITAPGNLTMAGVTRKVALAGEGVVDDDGTLSSVSHSPSRCLTSR